jgi:uncharacterized protein (DUF58 family)
VAQLPPSLTPQTLAKLRGLQLRARHVVEGTVAGLHRSPWHGFSIEFAEHREYVPGDDLRHVDWKVFGRTDKFYLKQYEDETNLLAYLVLDASESMAYRGPPSPLSKLEYAQITAAALAHLVLGQQDAVGVATFDARLRTLLRPSSSPAQWEQVLSALEVAPGEKKTAAGPVFHELAERFTKRGVVIVLSDFFDDVRSMVAGLKHFAYRRHDVVLLHVLDPAELEFPFTGPTEFEGLETYPELQADATSLRNAYLKEFSSYLQDFRNQCRNLGIEYRLLRTDQPLDAVMVAWLSERMAKVR